MPSFLTQGTGDWSKGYSSGSKDRSGGFSAEDSSTPRPPNAKFKERRDELSNYGLLCDLQCERLKITRLLSRSLMWAFDSIFMDSLNRQACLHGRPVSWNTLQLQFLNSNLLFSLRIGNYDIFSSNTLIWIFPDNPRGKLSVLSPFGISIDNTIIYNGTQK